MAAEVTPQVFSTASEVSPTDQPFPILPATHRNRIVSTELHMAARRPL